MVTKLQGGAAQLNDEGAEGFAKLLVMMRGAGAVGTTAIECKAITPPVLVDMQKVSRNHSLHRNYEAHKESYVVQWLTPCDVVCSTSLRVLLMIDHFPRQAVNRT